MASIKCGHCKNTHSTIAEVKTCAFNEQADQQVAAQLAASGPDFTVKTDGTVINHTHGPICAKPVLAPVTEPGMYMVGKEIYKVQWNKDKTHLYAKLLMVSAMHKGGEVKGWFTFAPGAMKKLNATHRMTLEAAVLFGEQTKEQYGTGICCQCGRLLTKKTSVEAGIGPICAGKF